MITEIEDYFEKGCGRCERFETPRCSALRWSLGLKKLREICLDVGLAETVKWGHPCYMRGTRNIAIIGAHIRDFRLSFFNAALMTDPDGVLEKQGPNTKHKDMFRFTDNHEVPEKLALIRAYLLEALSYAEAGINPPKVETILDLPAELAEALDVDTELAEAFHSLTPGRQRSYVINLSSATKSETRIARIEKFRLKIISGKGAMER